MGKKSILMLTPKGMVRNTTQSLKPIASTVKEEFEYCEIYKKGQIKLRLICSANKYISCKEYIHA